MPKEVLQENEDNRESFCQQSTSIELFTKLVFIIQGVNVIKVRNGNIWQCFYLKELNIIPY